MSRFCHLPISLAKSAGFTEPELLGSTVNPSLLGQVNRSLRRRIDRQCKCVCSIWRAPQPGLHALLLLHNPATTSIEVIHRSYQITLQLAVIWNGTTIREPLSYRKPEL
jgi:hypothetical protein